MVLVFVTYSRHAQSPEIDRAKFIRMARDKLRKTFNKGYHYFPNITDMAIVAEQSNFLHVHCLVKMRHLDLKSLETARLTKYNNDIRIVPDDDELKVLRYITKTLNKDSEEGIDYFAQTQCDERTWKESYERYIAEHLWHLTLQYEADEDIDYFSQNLFLK